MMLGIEAIGGYVPLSFVDNIEQGKVFEADSAFVKEKIGAIRLPRMEPGEETSDLCVKAVRALASKQPTLDLDEVQVVIVVTQNGDGEGLPHTSAVVQHKLGLSNKVAAFDVSLGCSGYVYGLKLITGFMESIGARHGLLITADPYSKIIDSQDRDTAMLFGDAATATWISDRPSWLVGRAVFGTDGRDSACLTKSGGHLKMNGRKVFNFAASRVPKSIDEVLDGSDTHPDDVDAFLLHQGSAGIVDAISRRFGADENKFLFDIRDTGNTVSSSIPLLMSKHESSSWKKIVISGFGVGLSWATAILERS